MNVYNNDLITRSSKIHLHVFYISLFLGDFLLIQWEIFNINDVKEIKTQKRNINKTKFAKLYTQVKIADYLSVKKTRILTILLLQRLKFSEKRLRVEFSFYQKISPLTNC